MKFPGEAAERVARSLGSVGPGTAADLAGRMGTSDVAVRKALGALVEAGLVEASERPPFGPAPTGRRGRPALTYHLTQAGHRLCAGGQEDLALQALDFVARTQGEQGVRAFAQERARAIVHPALAGAAVADVAALVSTLTEAGYSAEIAGKTEATVQLCQHSCPVSEAAAAYPQICQAETDVIAEVLGVNVTRLATIAHGDGVCTAVVSMPSSDRSSA